MRKAQKKQIEELLALLEQAHGEIRGFMEGREYAKAMDLLVQCQESAVQTGELIEKMEGEDTPTIKKLEMYCEQVYEVYETLSQGTDVNAGKVCKKLKKSLIQVENSVKNDIKVRLEMVFLPYKASMWDSLESVWRAADADPDCDAYVVPIPYFDKNRDGSFGEYHYEGDKLPSDVPVTYYTAYSFEERKPDAIFIHNPYDQYNNVTSVHPNFYSQELKKFTDCLVYIPYYTTSGGMNEAQGYMPSYYFVDYIVIQSEKFRNYFDPGLPKEKFLPFGSPKFDKVIRLCQNPPEPPAEWKEKMAGKKVYFYNTSINGMLADTRAFLKKMKYVFGIFQGRKDVCLLWRPHPLLESTFVSMRPEYQQVYDSLKVWFIQADIGILDETPDIEESIALSDVYIGDSGTSVTSLFGVSGKPIFILNNMIHTLPGRDDWRGDRINLQYDWWNGDDRYQVTVNNQLWFSEKNDYHYRFYMDLDTEYSEGNYYLRATEVRGKIYVLPRVAQDLLIIEDGKIRKIVFKKFDVLGEAFAGGRFDEQYKYLYLYPYKYPYLIRMELSTEKVEYIDGVQSFNVRRVQNEWQVGGRGGYEKELVFASPVDNNFLFVNMETLSVRTCCNNAVKNLGTQNIIRNGDDLWLMPMRGTVITKWNPKTGEVREYDSDLPEHFKNIRWPYGYEWEEHPFCSITFFQDGAQNAVIVSPMCGNMFLSFDRETGKMREWELPMGPVSHGKNEYFRTGSTGEFVVSQKQLGKPDCRFWYAPERRLYDLNIFTREYKEVEVVFDLQDLITHESGFSEVSEEMQYCLRENAFNSLEDILNDKITGKHFDRERQLKAFSRVNANIEGTCGGRVYDFVKKKTI